jgi:hypothetical protein
MTTQLIQTLNSLHANATAANSKALQTLGNTNTAAEEIEKLWIPKFHHYRYECDKCFNPWFEQIATYLLEGSISALKEGYDVSLPLSFITETLGTADLSKLLERWNPSLLIQKRDELLGDLETKEWTEAVAHTRKNLQMRNFHDASLGEFKDSRKGAKHNIVPTYHDPFCPRDYSPENGNIQQKFSWDRADYASLLKTLRTLEAIHTNKPLREIQDIAFPLADPTGHTKTYFSHDLYKWHPVPNCSVVLGLRPKAQSSLEIKLADPSVIDTLLLPNPPIPGRSRLFQHP